jgi:hypothetical protein
MGCISNWRRVCSALSVLMLAFLFPVGCGSGQRANVSGDYLSSIRPAKWNKSVVLYRIHGGPPVGASEVRRLIKTGIHRWDATFDGILTIREATGLEVEDIAIKWVAVGSLGGSWLGHQTLGRDRPPEARWRVEPDIANGVFRSVTVKLDKQLWVRPLDLLRLSMHEVGYHALWANEGHSPWPEDAGYSQPTASGPNQRDTNTARLVYGKQ